MNDLIEKAKQAKPKKKPLSGLSALMPVVEELRKNGLSWQEVQEWLQENANSTYNKVTIINCYNCKGPYAYKTRRDEK